MGQFEREEEYLEREYNEGRISYKEYNHEMMELRRDYAAAAHQSAQDAYDRELERW